MSQLHWIEADERRTARWVSENGSQPPHEVRVVGDEPALRVTPAEAWELVARGVGLLWRGDYHAGRELLTAMGKQDRAQPTSSAAPTARESFFQHRANQSRRALALGSFLVAFDAGFVLRLRRAPDLRVACREAYGEDTSPFVASLREVLGLVGAHEWRKKGVEIPALRARIHPYYGVYSPVRGEYIDLVARAPMPRALTASSRGEARAFDIGTGTGVLAAVLAIRGVSRVVATDQDARAVACARDNAARLGLTRRVEVVQGSMFPDGRASLIVCNPPWVPATPTSAVEHGVYDPDSQMLRSFLAGLAAHLDSGGEGWLILSDFAEHLGLRTRQELLGWISAGGLRVIDRLDTRPTHAKASDSTDPLHQARAAEVTSLWRLGLG
jgi:SAM-dependent methyltransferase